MDRGLDPPQRIGGKPGAAAGLKMRGRDDEAEIGLADQIGKRKVVSLVAARDLCRQAEMAGDERIGRAAVAMLLPAPGELLLPRLFEQSVSLDERGVFIDEIRAICRSVNVSRLSDISVVLWAFMGGSNPSGPAHRNLGEETAAQPLNWN